MLLQAETAFGLNLLKSLPANETLVFSPLSIALVLSLVHSGAKGKSKEQIGNAVLHGAGADQLSPHYQDISSDLKKGTHGTQANLANRLFVKKGFKVKTPGAETLDFETGEAANSINHFVGSATQNKINSIVSKVALKSAESTLISATTFKGDWAIEFSGISTFSEGFYYANGHMKEIPFMHSYACYRTYASDDLFEVAILDYKDPEYRFAIFLPKEKNGLTKALKKLNAARFQKLLSSAKRAYMITYIPKFTVEKKLSLDKTLPKLGITDIFSDSADLSGIADKLKISNGFHKAVMEVQEEGTDAAPEDSTKIVPYVPSQDEAVQFFATQPFVYAVLHKNHPLLLGVFHG